MAETTDEIIAEYEAIRAEYEPLIRKLEQARKIKKDLANVNREVCKRLLRYHGDEVARKSLVINLGHEEHFVEMIRSGSDKAVSILKKTLGKLDSIESDSPLKHTTREIILNLIDAMRFAHTKLKVIRKKIRQGRKLEKKGYPAQHLREFMQTLEEEEELDAELVQRLKGEMERIKPGILMLAREFKIEDRVVAGLFATTSVALVSIDPMARAFHNAAKRGELSANQAGIFFLAVSVILYSMPFLMGMIEYEAVNKFVAELNAEFDKAFK